jgi:hypothetical protein
MRKRTKKAGEASANTIDCLLLLQGEQAEAVQRLQPHYPGASDDELDSRATSLREQRYRLGRWPTAEEIEATVLPF